MSKFKTKRARRSFTAEFKAEAVKLVGASGKSIGEVAKDLDLTETALREWVRRAQEVNGQLVDDPAAVGDVIRATPVGTPIRFTVRSGAGTKDVSIAPANVQGVDHPIIGVVLVHTFPFAVSFRSGDIGGPSAGLMWALGLVDLLTPGELTGGHVIAGTGTISPDGTVGPIGGVQEKVAGAERSGATVFFVPLQDAKDARSVAGDITVVPVSTYGQAVRYLQTHG